MRLGIIGKAGSGKDLLGKILKEDYGFYALSMTSPLEKLCREKYGMKEKDRALLNRVGNEEFQKDPYYLLKRIEEELKAHGDQNIVLSGVRRPLEYAVLKDLGFSFLRVTSPPSLRKDRLEKRDGKKISPEAFALLEASSFERDQDQFLAYELENKGSIEDLKKGLADFFKAQEDLKKAPIENFKGLCQNK